MRIISPNLKILLLPVLVIPVLIIVSIFTTTSGYRNVNKQIRELRKIENDEKALSEKLSVLRKIRSDVLEKTNVALLALPETSPATQILSLIKTHSEQVTLPIDKVRISAGGGKTGGIINSSLEIETSSSGEDIDSLSAIKYLELLSESIPITRYKNVSISTKQGKLSLNVEGLLYASLLPEELPALTEPIKELSESEVVLIEEISEMFKPEFLILDPTAAKEDRQSPFLQLD